MEDLKDGEIFLEIIQHYLKKNKKDYIFRNEFNEAKNFGDLEKFEMIVKILKILTKENNNFLDNYDYEKIVK